MYGRRSPSPPRHRHSSSRRRSPSPRRRHSPGPSRRPSRSDHGIGADRPRERETKPRSEKDLPQEFARSREEENRQKIEDNRNVLEKMERSYGGGPLQLLNRACKQQSKLKIWTRNFKEVRGICTGYLVAFDKHWNLAVQDVDEICIKPKKGKTPYLFELKPGYLDEIPEAKPKVPKEKKKVEETATASATPAVPDSVDKTVAAPKSDEITEAGDEVQIISPKKENTEMDDVEVIEGEIADEVKKEVKKKTRKKKKTKIERRHVNQLFIRGDNVVMVSIIVPDPEPEAAATSEAAAENGEQEEDADSPPGKEPPIPS